MKNGFVKPVVRTLAVVFVICFVITYTIVTVFPACILLAMAFYAACSSHSPLLILGVTVIVSFFAAVIVTTIIHAYWDWRMRHPKK